MSEEDKDFLDEMVEEFEIALPPKPKKKERPAPPQMITFDRYFLSLGKPGHHRAGMEAYTNTKGKKTREAWEALFKHY